MGYDYDDGPGFDQSESGGGGKRPNFPGKQALTKEQVAEIAGECGGLWTPAQITRIYEEMGGWCGAGDLSSFLYNTTKRNLDPLMGEVHAEFRWDKRKSNWKMTTIIHIDALRKIADLTKQYDGQDEPVFLVDAKGMLVACTVKIYRKDCTHPFAATCYFSEYNTAFGNWKKMPHVMLAKCTEAAAFRKAFPAAMSGVYISEEMGRSDYSAVEPEAPATSNGNAAAVEPDGLAVGRKVNGAATATPTAPPNGSPAPPQDDPKDDPPPAEKKEEKPDGASVVRSRIDAAKREIVRRGGIKGQEATICVNTFLRTVFETGDGALPSNPNVYAGPLDILEKLVSDEPGLKALIKDPGAAARTSDPLERLFVEWNWQPVTRAAARQTRARLKINSEQFVLWVSSYLKLQDIPDSDVLAFFALSNYTNQAHRSLALARATDQTVSSVVHAVEVNLGKDLNKATEDEINAAIDKVEALKPPPAADAVTEDEPEGAR